MKTLIVSVIALVALAQPAYAGENPPPPKHDDSGCCFQFDNSPVNLVFCMTDGACRFEVPPK